VVGRTQLLPHKIETDVGWCRITRSRRMSLFLIG
jgi:hypothetical protein